MAPTAERIKAIFSSFETQGRQQEFLPHIAENVDWTILGHSPMSRHYSGREDFVKNTIVVLRERILTEPLRLRVVRVTGGGEGNEWSTVEMESIDAKCRNGLVYDMKYCWVIRWKGESMVEVRAYLDTDLLTRAMHENP